MNEDSKIYIIECVDYDNRSGKKEMIVSHGVGNNTMKNYVLYQAPICMYGKDVKYDEAGAYLEIKS